MNNQNNKNERNLSAAEIRAIENAARRQGGLQPGYISNAIIQRRNGGIRHQFQDSIGGCSSNYR